MCFPSDKTRVSPHNTHFTLLESEQVFTKGMNKILFDFKGDSGNNTLFIVSQIIN